jgi:hypothetical protein
MGQLKPNLSAVFLSASVPDPDAPHFMKEGDSAAIAAAISALLYVLLGRRLLVWGGHPAITPMIWSFSDSMNVRYGDWVKLYQSNYFADDFPEENAFFKNVVFTQAINNDQKASLRHMRDRMLSETDFQAAVFIGGMRGVLDEYHLFRAKAPDAKIIPIASTGGAAQVLASELSADKELFVELDYVRILHMQLGIDPNEQRYNHPQEQPTLVSNRIKKPGGQDN